MDYKTITMALLLLGVFPIQGSMKRKMVKRERTMRQRAVRRQETRRDTRVAETQRERELKAERGAKCASAMASCISLTTVLATIAGFILKLVLTK